MPHSVQQLQEFGGNQIPSSGLSTVKSLIPDFVIVGLLIVYEVKDIIVNSGVFFPFNQCLFIYLIEV